MESSFSISFLMLFPVLLLRILEATDVPRYLNQELTQLEVTGPGKMASTIGFHECEISICTDPSQAETDLQTQLIMCNKNPGHRDFISVNKFNDQHIPRRFRDIDMFNLIRAMINLTVRICSTFTSEERPKTFPGTDKLYPFYNQRGKKYTKTGTGMVCVVWDYTTEGKRERGKEDEKTCPCTPCRNSPTPKTQWYVVEVNTAQHVVFNRDEAQHATCQLFFDGDSEEEKNKIQEFKGETTWKIHDINYDVCFMDCYIHDLKLGEKLEEMCDAYDELRGKLFHRFKNSVIEHPLTAIVSHPHGRSKQVTIGEMKQTEKVDNRYRYIYTAQTCPGSSGAPVFVVGRHEGVYADYHPHSERCREEGLNASVFFY